MALRWVPTYYSMNARYVQASRQRVGNFAGRTVSPAPRVAASFPELSQGFSDPSNELVPRLGKSSLACLQEFFQHENVVPIVSRDGGDGDAVVRERVGEREQYYSLGGGVRYHAIEVYTQ